MEEYLKNRNGKFKRPINKYYVKFNIDDEFTVFRENDEYLVVKCKDKLLLIARNKNKVHLVYCLDCDDQEIMFVNELIDNKRICLQSTFDLYCKYEKLYGNKPRLS